MYLFRFRRFGTVPGFGPDLNSFQIPGSQKVIFWAILNSATFLELVGFRIPYLVVRRFLIFRGTCLADTGYQIVWSSAIKLAFDQRCE